MNDETKIKQLKRDAVVGLPFYSEADWQIQCQNGVDEPPFRDYAEARKKHEDIKQMLELREYTVVEIPINAAEMQEYFEKNGLKNNSKNRSRYVAERIRQGGAKYGY